MPPPTAHLRIARPTGDIDALLPFYRDGLGFEVLLTFEDHEGFDGVVLGARAGGGGSDGDGDARPGPAAGCGYHLEFTRCRLDEEKKDPDHAGGGSGSGSGSGSDGIRAPSRDNLLVFYLPEAAEYEAATARMAACGFGAVVSFNPYWDRCGRTYEDPDGWRVVLVDGGPPC